MYYIGIDGGGTYSRLIAVDNNMKVVGRHTGNSTNLTSNPYETVFDNIKKLIYEFNKLTNTSKNDCAALCIGSAGIDTQEYVVQMEALIKELGFQCPVKAVNDSELILATETKGGPGIAIIAGTGSIGYAIDQEGNSSRSGGWGYLIDDGGSGYWIGIQAIKSALLAHDGRAQQTVLTEKLLQYYKLDDITNVLNHVYSDTFNKAKIAEIALLVKEATAEGDKVAEKIEKDAANELFNLAQSLITRNKLNNHTIVLSGSVILLNEHIRSTFVSLVSKSFPNIKITSIKEKPEIGAIYIAQKLTR